jgi:hypothetical protein
MSGHGHIDPANKKIALLIAVLALVLAISETLGKAAQTSALSLNIEASNMWAFFQAKAIRGTSLRAVAEEMEVAMEHPANKDQRAVMEKRIADWKKTIARYDSEPDTGEGRKELAARAKDAETKRDRAMAAYHQFELGSGAVQIAIVLASASVITAAAWLTWIAVGLGMVGIVFSAIGIFAPQAIHLF